MHSEVGLCDIIRANISSLDGMLEDGSHVHWGTTFLLRRLADLYKKRDDADLFEMDEDRGNENGGEGGDESMDVD
jgi:hypothetical protein